jgi:predicted ATP-dependent serine protease
VAPFVGRVSELEALAELDGAAVRGEVAVALITGDPGSGKSRLLAEAAARSRRRIAFASLATSRNAMYRLPRRLVSCERSPMRHQTRAG